MKNGICPRCGKAEVYAGLHTIGTRFIKISFWEDARVIQYVCTSCGYIEDYVEDESRLEVIREKWSKVNPAPQGR